MNLQSYLKHSMHNVRDILWQRKLNHFPSTADGKRLLHIGCGEINSPEFINLDARPMSHVHIVSKNILNLRNIPNESLDMVYMSHVLEHVPRNQVSETIKEMHRVLKKGGVLRVSVPDFDHIVNIYQSTEKNIQSIAPALMGGQDYKFNFHYCIFNKNFLEHLLLESEFEQVMAWDPNNCEHHEFEDWASKSIYVNDRPYPISLNLEARKRH